MLYVIGTVNITMFDSVGIRTRLVKKDWVNKQSFNVCTKLDGNRLRFGGKSVPKERLKSEGREKPITNEL